MQRHKLIIIVAIQLLVVYAGTQAQTTSLGPVIDCASASTGTATLKRQQPSQGSNDDETAIENDRRPSFTNFNSAPKVKPVEFIGLSALKESEALNLLCQRKAFPSNQRLNQAAVKISASTLKEILTTRGYANADVHAFVEKGTVRFFVNEGIRLPIAELRFEGNKVFSSRRLLDLTNECLIRVGEGTNGYDSEKLDYCQRILENHIRNDGYLQATLRQTSTKINEKGYVVSFTVDEGTQYRLGKIKIEGANVFTADQIRVSLSLREGDIARADSISKWLFEDLKNTYGEMGFIEYSAELSPTFKREQGLLDLKVDVDEGKRFSVRSIHFVGELIKEVKLEDLFLLKAGHVYNHRLLREGIERINDTGQFVPVDIDKDVELNKIGDDGLIQIFIRMKVRR